MIQITELRDNLPFLCSCLGQSWKSASVLELAKLVNKDMQTEEEADGEGRRQTGDAIIKENGRLIYKTILISNI